MTVIISLILCYVKNKISTVDILVSGHFVPWSDRSKSDRSNQLSDVVQ